MSLCTPTTAPAVCVNACVLGADIELAHTPTETVYVGYVHLKSLSAFDVRKFRI